MIAFADSFLSWGNSNNGAGGGGGSGNWVSADYGGGTTQVVASNYHTKVYQHGMEKEQREDRQKWVDGLDKNQLYCVAVDVCSCGKRVAGEDYEYYGWKNNSCPQCNWERGRKEKYRKLFWARYAQGKILKFA